MVISHKKFKYMRNTYITMAKIIQKSGFHLKDTVLFDDFKKEGIITALSPDKLTIFTGKSTLFRHPQVVYKKDETLGCGHWDTLNKSERIKILIKHKVAKDLARRDWQFIPGAIKQAIYKAEGTNSGINTDTQNVYNPVSTNTTVTDRIRNEIKEQSKDKPKESSKEKPKDAKKNKIKKYIHF